MIWVCVKDIGNFKAGTIVEVYNEDGDRMVMAVDTKIKEKFHWDGTKEFFKPTSIDCVSLPYYIPRKTVSNLIRGVFGRPKKLDTYKEFIQFGTNSDTKEKIKNKIVPYIMSIDEEILIEFSGVLIRSITNLRELCKHRMGDDIDEEINKVNEIVKGIFQISQNLTKEIASGEKTIREDKINEFRKQFREDLNNSLEFVKTINSN